MRMYNRHSVREPEILRSKYAEELRAELQNYLAAIEREGAQRRPPSVESLLSTEEVNHCLGELFDNTCAFCETPMDQVRFGPFHHFRPYGFAADMRGETSVPHYVWLGLDWDNLYNCCYTCGFYKKNHFVVRGKRGRIGASVSELRETEAEQLIDPCWTDPSLHLQADSDGSLIPLSQNGETTLEVFNLNRQDLKEWRAGALGTAVHALRSGSDLAFNFAPQFPDKEYRLLTNAEGTPVRFAGFVTNYLSRWAEQYGFESPLSAELAELILSEHEVETTTNLESFLSSSDQSITRLTFSSTDHELADTPSPRERRVTKLHELPGQNLPINKVTIHSFKGVRDVTLELPEHIPGLKKNSPCILILGENATGKSTMLEAITLALLGTREIRYLDELLKDDDLTPRSVAYRDNKSSWNTIDSRETRIDISFLGSEEEVHLIGYPKDLEFSGTRTPSRIVLSYGPRRFFQRRKKRRYRAPVYRCLSQFDPLATIPNPSDWLLSCSKSHFDAAVRALREVLMLEECQKVERNGNGIFIGGTGGLTPLDELSVGYKSVVALCTDIIMELFYYYDNTEHAHAVVLIDEIETHLHPRWKMKIMRLLRKAFPAIQFIATTHDPLCLRGMHDGEVFLMNRNETTAKIELVDDLPSVQGMRAEQLLTSDFFGLGSTDPETDAKLFRYHKLARKDELSAAEQNELNLLDQELNRTLMTGDTELDRLWIETMEEHNVEPLGELPKITPAKKKKLKSALASFLDGDK